MARTINRGAGRGGGRGGNYGRGRGYGRGKGGGRGGRQGVVWTRKARECNTPCHNAANNDLRDRYRKYYEFICATNEETRQEPGTYLKVLKGIYYHGEEVDSYDAALRVKGVGPMHARKCASAVRWREHLDASIVPVQRGRWAAPPKQGQDKPRWWRVETVEVPTTGKCMARRQWGLEGTAGYDEDFKDFSERRKCDLDVAAWIRRKEGEGYQRSAHGGDDGADHYVPPPDEEEQREVVPRVRRSKYGPKFLDKDTGSLSGVCALLVALHRRSPLDKATLAQEAQQHTRVAMTAHGQQWYGGIKSLDTLLKNDIVEPVPHDVRRFRLTSEAGSGLVSGVELARDVDARYRKELEHAAPQRDDDSDEEAPQKRRRSCLERLRNDVDGARPFLDVYDITLYVDSREKRKNDNHEADAIVGLLHQGSKPMNVKKAPLQVGDYLFIATPKNEQQYDTFWRDRGIVVGSCIERKCASDFHTTVKGKSHHRKQTLALSRCGVPATYVIEGDIDSLDICALDKQDLHDEMARLEIQLGFTVHRSPSFEHTVRYLQGLDSYLRQDLRRKSVDDVLQNAMAYRDIVSSLGIDERQWDLKARFGAFLLHVPGVKNEYVAHILAKYPTFALLKRALDSHSLEEPLLTRILVPGARRRADAKKIADFFVLRDYPSGQQNKYRTMAQRFVGQPGGKTAFDKRHSDDSLAPAAQLQRRETSKRLVSWEEGNNQLALLDSDYKAAHCRRYTGRATVREPTFSLREFCKAYAYETLPPVLDLAAASLLEGSLAKGWHVTGYRALRPSPAHIGWGNSLFAGVFGHITWAPLVYAVNYAYFTSRVVRAHVDPVELLVLDVFQLIRNGVVATKYAYFEAEDLEAMRHKPPSWNWDRTDRQLLLGGGLSPKDYAGLLQTLVLDAMATADIDLRAVDVAIDEDGAAAVRDLVKATGGDAFAAPEGRTSAAAVLWCLLARHWSVGLAPKAVLFVVAEVLMILFLPAIERTALGGAPYGPPGLVRFVLVMYTVLLAFGPKTATPTLIFPMAAANDWHRRAKVLGCLGDVFDAPGLSAGDLVRPTENTEGKVAPAAGTRIFLDPHDPKNVFAHAMMRPVLRRIALKIRLRCQAYLWIYFAGAIAALVVLNVLLWYPLSHRLLAAHLAALFAVLTGLAVVIIFVAAKATNDIVPVHRSRLQRERLAIEREISSGVDSTRAVTLEHARRLLKTLDENIAFEEVEREPASVLGVAASAGTIGSVLSLLLGGLLFAFEGYNSSRQNGWKYGEDGVFSKE